MYYLFGRWGHALLHNNTGSVDIFILHSLTQHFDGFDADFRLVRKEDKHLISRVVIVSYKDNQITPLRMAFTARRKKVIVEPRMRTRKLSKYLGLSPNCSLNCSRVWSNSSCVTRYPLSWHSYTKFN
jgi:hypothetical protein